MIAIVADRFHRHHFSFVTRLVHLPAPHLSNARGVHSSKKECTLITRDLVEAGRSQIGKVLRCAGVIMQFAVVKDAASW